MGRELVTNGNRRESVTNGFRIGNGGSWNNTSKHRQWRKSVTGANKAKRWRRFGDEEWAYRRRLVAFRQRFINDGSTTDHQQRRRWMAHRQRFNAFLFWVSLFLTEWVNGSTAMVNGSSATVQRFGDGEWLISNGSMIRRRQWYFFLFGFLFFLTVSGWMCFFFFFGSIYSGS